VTAEAPVDRPALVPVDELAAVFADLDEVSRRRRLHDLIRTLADTGAPLETRTTYRDAVAARRWMSKGDFTAAYKEAAADRKAKTRANIPARTPRPAGGGAGKPHIEAGGAPEAIRNLTAAVDGGTFADLYVTNGEIVHVGPVSGEVGTSADDPLPLASGRLEPSGFASLLAHEAYVFRTVHGPNDTMWEEEHAPPERVLAAVLSRRHWPRVRPLRGIVGSPVLRPDGSLLQEPGYDLATGLYYAPKVALPAVPDRPSRDEVLAARQFVDRVIHDFPWVAPADKANYLAILITPILRPYLRTLAPFWMATATTASSGKSLLVDMVGSIYGKQQNPWPGNDDELRKAVLAALRRPEPLIVWDNIEEGTQIKSAVLAGLITAPEWSDRVLGSSRSEKHLNDRLWAVTGNNLRLGGDMATRAVVTRLDPNMPNPETRPDSAFQIPNLQAWLGEPDNCRNLQWNLLVLVADWVASGTPRSDRVMRQFSPWAQAAGGFVAHHGLPGFLDNAADVADMDDQAATWQAFLARWEQKYGTQQRTSAELRGSFDRDPDGTDPWDGTIPASLMTGRHHPTAQELGARLRGHVGRWYGPHVLRATTDRHSGARLWRVETREHQP